MLLFILGLIGGIVLIGKLNSFGMRIKIMEDKVKNIRERLIEIETKLDFILKSVKKGREDK